MYYECRMILQSYVPDQPRKGMLFMTLINNNPYVYELNNVRDYDNYVIESGFPVLPYIYDIGNPNLENHAIIAVPDQIGWFDVGEHSDELIDVEVKHINTILQDYDGWIDVEIDDSIDGDVIVPVLFQNKITLRYAEEITIEDEEDFDEID